MKKFRPLNDRVLVRPATLVEQPTLGLARPETQREKLTYGEVLAAGEKVQKRVVETRGGHVATINSDGVAIGEIVHWNEYSGKDIEVDGEMLLLLRIDEINGVFEEDKCAK